MKQQINYPYIKVHTDCKNRVRYVGFWNQKTTAVLEQDEIGEQLLRFRELDLSAYKKRVDPMIELLKNEGFQSDRTFQYGMLMEEVFNIAKILVTKHPLIYFFLKGLLDNISSSQNKETQKAEIAILALDEVLVLQDIFTDGLNICCDIDFKEDGLPENGKFILFCAKYSNFTNYNLITGNATAPTTKGFMDFDEVDRINQLDNPSQMEQLKLIDKHNTLGLSVIKFTYLQNLSDFLYFEFIEIITRGLRIRKCKNCREYFILRSKHETFYCNRIFDDGKTCKQIGNKKTYLENVQKDELLQRYERMCKAAHARMDRRQDNEILENEIGLAKEKYREWSKQAIGMRKKYVDGNISKTKFNEWIEKMI